MTLAVSLSGLMYYTMLYQTRLVPRWLSGWGLVGTTLTSFATLLVMFRLIDIITTSYLVLIFPMALQEFEGFGPELKPEGDGLNRIGGGAEEAANGKLRHIIMSEIDIYSV